MWQEGKEGKRRESVSSEGRRRSEKGREKRKRRKATHSTRTAIPTLGEPSGSDPFPSSSIKHKTSLGNNLTEHDLSIHGPSVLVVKRDLARSSSISSVSRRSGGVGVGGEISSTVDEGRGGGLGDVAVAAVKRDERTKRRREKVSEAKEQNGTGRDSQSGSKSKLVGRESS